MLKLKFSLFGVFFILLHLVGYSAPLETTPPPRQEVEVVPQAPVPAEEAPSSSEATTSYEGAFVKMIVTLIALLVFVFIAFWMIRKMAQGRFKSGNFNRTIKIIEKRPLSAKSMLYVIEINDKKILISESQLEVRAITTIDEISLS